jgi:RNA polymerase sigma factor (sigma-70 family)
MQEQLNRRKEEKLLKQYTDLMYKLTNKYFGYYGKQYTFEDLFQEAQLATLKAIRTYDESKNVKLITHIYNQINFRFSHYSRANTGIIKVPAKYISDESVRPKIVDCDFMFDNAESDFGSYKISDNNLMIDEYLNVLSDKQKDIVSKIHLYGYTCEEVAKMYGVSRQFITQSVNSSLNKIRKNFENMV